MLWTRFNVYLLVNGGLLAALATSSDTSLISKHADAIPMIGILVTLAWFLSERSGRTNLRFFDGKVSELEKLIWTTELKDFRFLAAIDQHPYLKYQSYVSLGLIVVVAVGWLLLLCKID